MKRNQQMTDIGIRATEALKELGTMPVTELAKKHNLSKENIKYYARKAGLNCAFLRKPWTEFELSVLISCAPTHNTKEIAKKLKRSRHSICCKAAALGISMRKHGEKHHAAKYSDEDAHYVKLLLDDGELTHKQIADIVEVHPSFVKNVVAGFRN